MMNKQSTKRALLASVLSIVVCLSMLVGSTFAWFSDTASTAVNKIQAGTLDVGLEVSYDNGETWEDAEGKTLDFIKADGSDEILWEPGCTYELPMLRVTNKGNLALKFWIAVSGIDGNAKLNEVIDWNYSYKSGEGVSYYDDPATGDWVFGLEPKGNLPFVISGHMQETAGNEYQGLSIEGIGITVLATQLPSEYDSHTNTYDENADGTPDLPEYAPVTDSADLVNALKNADVNGYVYVGSGKYEINESVETKGSLVVAPGCDVQLTLNGNSITSVVNAEVNVPTVLNKGNLTIVGGTVENKNATNGNTNVAAVKNVSGVLTLTDCTVTNVAPTTQGAYAVTVTGGKVVMNNCKVTGARGGIAVSNDGVVEMTDGSVTATGKYYPLYVTGTGASTFTGVSFSQTAGKSMTYNLMKETGSVTFTDCTFTATKTVKFDVFGVTTGFVFKGTNTFNKVTDPNA